jgi:hypothetical protein
MLSKHVEQNYIQVYGYGLDIYNFYNILSIIIKIFKRSL